MQIPFNDFKKEYHAHKKGVDGAVQKVLESGWYILGKEVESFEKNFAEYIGAGHAVGVGNGMEALQIALLTLGVGKGDEVITTSLSAVATALAIVAVGATPVFADIDRYFHLDPKDVENKITPKTKAIIPVHLYGQAADIAVLRKISKKYNVFIVEDCAQAHGAIFKGKRVGTFGAANAFSFYPTKNLGAYGDGGAVVTKDPVLAEKIRMARNYGQSNRYEHPIYGLNSRLDELQAAILSVKLKTLDKENAKRNAVADIYKNELNKVKEISLPLERPGAGHIYHLFVIETEKRDELQKYLKEKGIATLIHYPIPIHKQKSFSKYNALSLPRTERAAGRILSLPCNPFLTTAEVRYICKQIKDFSDK
jgi:dTDP-4-amino-4,6-dideoxygalactose transaminase